MNKYGGNFFPKLHGEYVLVAFWKDFDQRADYRALVAELSKNGANVRKFSEHGYNDRVGVRVLITTDSLAPRKATAIARRLGWTKNVEVLDPNRFTISGL